jgi:hypothetical protein
MRKILSYFSRLIRSALTFVEARLFDALRPSRAALVLGALGDLTRSRTELIA